MMSKIYTVFYRLGHTVECQLSGHNGTRGCPDYISNTKNTAGTQ